MAVGGLRSANGWMEIKFSDRDRRMIERLTKAIEKMEKPGRVTYSGIGPEEIQDTKEPQVSGGLYVYRDAITGNYVDEEYARAHPDTTVKEIVN